MGDSTTGVFGQGTRDRIQLAMTSWHERVNVRGERIALPLESPLGQAAWMKDRIAHANLHKTRAIAKTQPPDGGRRRGCSCSGPAARVMNHDCRIGPANE